MSIIVFFMSQICLNGVTISGNMNIKKSKENTEIYTENFSINNYFYPTSKIFISDSLRYTKTKKGTNETEVITPTATLAIQNDIFNFNFSGTVSETLKTKKEDLFSSNYNFNLSSFYKKIVDLNLSYSNSRTYDNLNQKKLDSETEQYGITLKRDFFKYFSSIYDFKKTINKNKVKETKNINYIENLIINFSKFSINFLNFNALISSNYNYRKTKMKADVNENGIALFPISTSIKTSPFLNEETYISDNQTIIIQIPETGVDIIYFYKDGVYLEQLSNTITWTVYWSETGEEGSYQIIDSGIAFPYPVKNTYKKSGYLKFEVSSLPDNNIELNNPLIQCYLVKTSIRGYAEMKSFSRSFTFNLNSEYQFNEKIDSYYNLTYSLNNPSPGLKKESISQSVSTNFNLNKLVNISTLLSRDEQHTEKSPSSISYNFSITNNSEILKTLTTTFTYGYTLNLISSKRTNSSHNFDFSINGQIYPDLTAKWSNSFSLNKSFSENSETKTFSTSVSVTARFTPSITLTSNYKLTKNISPNSTIDQNILNNFSWRISEIIFLNINENITIPDSGEKEYNHSFSFWIAPTKKIQYNLNFTTIRGTTKSDTISNFVSWKISNKISTKGTFNKKIVKGEHSWDAMFSLNFAF